MFQLIVTMGFLFQLGKQTPPFEPQMLASVPKLN